jgi:hypothetical protein
MSLYLQTCRLLPQLTPLTQLLISSIRTTQAHNP